MARNNKGFMLLSEADKPFVGADTIAQIKHDGRRVQVEKRDNKIIMRGRDNIVQDRYPEVIKALKKIPHNFKIDTEFAVFDGDTNHTDRGLLQTRDRTEDKFKQKLLQKIMPVTPAVFDLLELDGNDVRTEPYHRRKQLLSNVFSNQDGIKVVKDYKDPLEAWELAQREKLEGIVERDVNAPYIEGRTDKAVKVKRKRIFLKEFDGYEMNPVGITLTNSETNLRCSCLGKQHIEVKDRIDRNDKVKVYVRGMADITKANKIREIVFYKLAR